MCELCFHEYTSIQDAEPGSVQDRAIYWDHLISLFEYKDSFINVIHQYKTGMRRDCARYFAGLFFSVALSRKIQAHMVVSVPPSRKKMRKRGFDPARDIAVSFAAMMKLPYIRMLRESRAHSEQKRLGSDDRYINSIGRFYIPDTFNLKGKMIILLDDVMTTGATVNECSRILKKKGAREVFSLTVARVDEKNLK